MRSNTAHEGCDPAGAFAPVKRLPFISPDMLIALVGGLVALGGLFLVVL